MTDTATARVINCPYCGQQARCITSEQFYGRDFGSNIYECRSCDAYVTTHGRSLVPKGTLANAETREWRKKAHAAFDPIWKTGRMQRRAAYSWMQNVMEMTPEQAHIGMFDVESCKKLIEKVAQWRANT